MGNNYAKVAKCEAADPTILVPPPPLNAPGGGGAPPPPTATGPPVNERFKDNPGNMDEFHKKCKEILPVPFEGARLVIGKSLSHNFQVSHHLTLSGLQPSGYRFGATYAGSMINLTEPKAVLMGDIDPSGNMNAQGFYSLTEALKLKWMSQIKDNKFHGLQTSVDLRGSKWTLSSSLINPSIQAGTAMGVVQYLHAVTSRVSLGAEAMCQKSPQIPQGYSTVFTGSARYTDDINVVSGFVGNVGAGLYYYRRLNEELQIGVEVERIQEQVSAAVAYQYEIPKANFLMKGMIDNHWTVTGLFEKKLVPMPCTFSVCASLNHIKNQFRVGCGVNIEL